MSSLIPKIKIGVDTHKSKFDVSSMTHTTSEIGYVQPTFSKNLVPGSRLNVQTRTGSRLSPLFVPTMGEIDIRHYHVFVPFSTIWTPFDAFLTKTNYTTPDAVTYVPLKVPFFTVALVMNYLFSYSSPYRYNSASDGARGLTCSIYKAGTLLTGEELSTLFDSAGASGYASKLDELIQKSVLKYVAEYYHTSDKTYSANVDSNGNIDINDTTLYESNFSKWSELSYPSLEHCDFSCYIELDGDVYHFCYNLNGRLKRLRTIFLGLGYSFNPYDDQQVSVFKLLSFYKAYWSLFGVNRSYNFYNTSCYKIIKRLSDTQYLNLFTENLTLQQLFMSFIIDDLMNCTYTCPADYFSASDTTTQRGGNMVGKSNPFNDGSIGTLYGFNSAQTNVSTPTSVGASASSVTGVVENTPNNSPMAMKIAQRLLRFVNKNSVVGRSISEILRTRYGISDIHNLTHESVQRIGADNVPINITAVYNNTDSGEMPLGSYAGLGVGSSRGKKVLCDAKEFGVFITLTAVVPKMGYFQGILRENSDGIGGSLDFFTPEFDAMGWQAVKYNELIADRQFMDDSGTLKVGTDLGVFGYMPTYSHLKVGFNRVLGDISLPSRVDSMLPYTLDRYFPPRSVNPDGKSYSVNELPPNEPNYFRSGTLGETNRIFADVSPTDDHVILQIFFDMKMTAPMKSLATSFDTYDEDSTHSTDVSHE